MRMSEHDELAVSDPEKIEKDQILLSHIIHCMDSGWGFVYEKPTAAQVFSDARETFNASTKIKYIDDRIAARLAILKSLVDAGWVHVNIPFASNNTKRVFADAKEYVDECEMGKHVAIDKRASKEQLLALWLNTYPSERGLNWAFSSSYMWKTLEHGDRVLFTAPVRVMGKPSLYEEVDGVLYQWQKDGLFLGFAEKCTFDEFQIIVDHLKRPTHADVSCDAIEQERPPAEMRP